MEQHGGAWGIFHNLGGRFMLTVKAMPTVEAIMLLPAGSMFLMLVGSAIWRG
jgi:hypothetical protein